MKRNKFKTLNGLFRALQKHCNEFCSEYTILKTGEGVFIFNPDGLNAPFSGVLIDDLIPVLNRALWMVKYNMRKQRVELFAWIDNDII